MNETTVSEQVEEVGIGANGPVKTRSKRGFACMDRDKVRAIASKGGKAAHMAGTAHQFTSEEAQIAGKKGGLAPHARRGGPRKPKSGVESGEG